MSRVKVTIKLLNVYRRYLPEHAQGSAYSLQIAPGTRITELLAQIPVPMDEKPVILVNGSTPDAHQVLVDGDVVAIFPSIAGGR
jgi:molybdopterin converting factor small subunit